MKVCIIQGYMYGRDLPAGFFVRFASSGKVYDSFVVSQEKEGVARYTALIGSQQVLLPSGRYEDADGKEILSISLVRKPTHTTDAGEPLPFTDEAYAVAYGTGDESSFDITILSTDVSENTEKWPKILRDGNTEMISGESYSYTYPVEYKAGNPDILMDENDDTEGMIPLKHGVSLKLYDEGKVVRDFTWDQLSKIWYEETKQDHYEMIRICGGAYRMGDYRGRQSNYSFGMHNTNMKKNWAAIYDPEYMGESEKGTAAVGVSGLKDENSSAKEKDSPFWCYNEDAASVHDVEISDFEMGKFLVTMDAFYGFVRSLKGDAADSLSYDVKGKEYPVCHMAGLTLIEKMRDVKDNGWGMGQRPAINVTYYEAVEYCNYMSRRDELDACYEILPIFGGEYAKGLTNGAVLQAVPGSCMQRTKVPDVSVQFVEIRCDLDKTGYRLPTEAEYEYAIRGGENMKDIRGGLGALYAGIQGDGVEYNCDVSWQRRNTDNPQKNGGREGDAMNDAMGGNGYTAPVGTKLPSQLGLYDLSGNTWDMVNDIFSLSYFEECAAMGTLKNPQGPLYDVGLMSVLHEGNADPALKDEYLYSYEKTDDGSMKRVGAVSLAASGKTMHTLRGGCFTNPFPFTSALHRHSVTGPAFIYNMLFYYNARISFRMVRSIR